MGTGHLPDETLSRVMAQLKEIPGDYAEIGVYKGALFKRLVRLAHIHNRTAHAFDSFEGMDTPSKNDGTTYYKGRLSSGGIDNFRRIILESIQDNRNPALNSKQTSGPAAPIQDDVFQLWEGYVPECLKKCPVNDFAFIYIDLDHQNPTRIAIDWSWPRLRKGGIIGFDDYFPEHNMLASPPIDEFLKLRQDDIQLVHFSNNQLFARKCP